MSSASHLLPIECRHQRSGPRAENCRIAATSRRTWSVRSLLGCWVLLCVSAAVQLLSAGYPTAGPQLMPFALLLRIHLVQASVSASSVAESAATTRG